MGHLLLGVLTIFLTPLDIVIILYSQGLHRFNWMFASFFVLQFSCYPSRLTFLLHESTSFRIPSNESLLAGGELLVFDYLKISWFCLDYFLKFFFLMWTIFLKSLYWICYNIVSVVCLLVFWPQGMWDLSFLRGIKPAPPTMEDEILTTGPPGKSPGLTF